MAAIVSSIEIDRPPAVVFAYATDPARFAEWQRDVVRVEVDGAGVGSRFTTVRRIGGIEHGMVQQVTESRPPHTWGARGVGGPIRPNATVTVEPLEGGQRSRAMFTLDFDAHGMADLLVPIVRRMTAKAAPLSYQRLKELLEDGTT
jgi:uncharacterized protein YndB with AHSA1/START domain